MRYKSYLAPKEYPTDQEVFDNLSKLANSPPPVVRNVRHINPIRESGPLPAYDGPHTMEDIRKIYTNTSLGYDFNHCSTDVDEIMRRVPGITRKECEFIVKLGLNPDEEVDFAYLVYNLGLDVTYMANQIYVARQVVTNSKGEKVEVYWNWQAFEDLAMLSVGFAPIMENVDYHWEIFLWGDPPIHPLVDFDLSVPNTWFEYEQEWWQEQNILHDQQTLPENLRRFPTVRNPHARTKLWHPQDKLQRLEQLVEEDWAPEDTKYDIYNQASKTGVARRDKESGDKHSH
jgi:hypothetical protein